MLAGSASAHLDVPNNPLTTASRVPQNIMFIMDNSGSMALVSMPFDVEDPDYTGTDTGNDRTGLRDDPHDRSYLNNTIYYNPNILYQPWMKADGTRMSGGENVSSVFAHWNSVGGLLPFTRDLRGNEESIFYVPKTGVTASTSPADFDRYRINAAGRVVLSNYSVPSGYPKSGLSASGNNRNNNYYTFSVPTGVSSITVETSGGSGNADLYLQRPNSTLECAQTTNGNNHSCAANNPAAGTWTVNVYRAANYSNVTLRVSLVTETEQTPLAQLDTDAALERRTQGDELKNIATWYSYYRTRLKTAKAGALDAFVDLGRELRVGYTPINNRPSGLGSAAGNEVIPVGTNNGLFEGDNKTAWYSSVTGEYVQDGSTPLRTALNAVGRYYMRSDYRGPYGPQTGADQLSCRQNFAILTTDGYWNGAGPDLGDSDGDGHSVTLADVADYYYSNDLRAGASPGGLPNNVLASTADPANWQHMVTFGISIGLKGTMDNTVDPPPAPNAAVWPDPMDAENAERIDDLWHAAVNGHGKFITADNPKAFSDGLKAALNEIEARDSSFSNVATNSVSLDTGTQVFNASYLSGSWAGRLSATDVGPTGVDGTVDWDASLPAYLTRKDKVFTSQIAGGAKSGTAFPSTAQVDRLTRTGVLETPVTGLLNAAYIEGSRALERSSPGGTLRNRTSVLGDIVNSSPAYVKDTNTIYVGANDGMLHAFNATNGNEIFAYVPDIINWADLATYSRPDYAHKFFVDGPIAVSNRTLTPGENILVGSLGRGGKGLYSLNVGNPAAATAANVFNWELGETGGNNMGLVLGKPLLTQTADGSKVAIIGNGPNSTNDRAVLIVVNLETGVVIAEIDTGAGSAHAAPNGLSAPTGVYGPDGKTIAYVYAGDLLGNVWKFDLRDDNPANWSKSKLFEAGTGQPITGGVAVATHPISNERWVFFGTGRFLTTGDILSRTTQSMYGIIDRGATVKRTDANLTRRTVNVTDADRKVRGFQSKTPLPESSKGWYIDLPASGERIVQDAQVVSTFLVTASMIPSEDDCLPGGTGYINALDAFTGTSTSAAYFDLDGDGSTSDETVGTPPVPVGSVNVGTGMPTLPSLMRGLLVAGGTGGAEIRGLRTLAPRWDRMSWREIRQD